VRKIYQLIFAIALSSVLIACATTAGSSATAGSTGISVKRFENILVIGVANDYDGRARFEREMVSELKSQGKAATAYYIAVGGDKPIDRSTIENLAKSENFDAVLITKVLNRDSQTTVKAGSTETKTVRQDSALFRYDYQELNEPTTLNVAVAITISSELFDVASGEKTWGMQAELAEEEFVSKIVDQAVSKISRQLKKDGVS
jgi:hypothetical protein